MKHIKKYNSFIQKIYENIQSDSDRIKYIEDKIKKEGVNSITVDDVEGIGVSSEDDGQGIPTFSDLHNFEYHEDLNKWKNRIVFIGDSIYLFNNEGKYRKMMWLDYSFKTQKIEKTDVPQRVIDYGNAIPKSGEITVVHGSPYGKIDKFDERMWGKGYQQEELPHERFAGIYTSDDTYFNRTLNGYGKAHLYKLKFDNSINEKDAVKLLREYEKEVGERLNRIEATNFIKSGGYDMIYRKEEEGTYVFIGLDVNKISPL